ncbi:MAG TPA: alpha/beta hydrolase [Candidatus Binataceae bacterium]|nr:alpha/beta hydrolase [Candidatus Binataceae bacterium]
MALEPGPSIAAAFPENRYITLNGLRLHYADWGGDDALGTFVLLHGGAANTHWWDAVAPALTGQGRVLALDFRGHGESQWAAPDSYGPKGYVADTEAFLSQLKVPVVLVGHSMGGMVALWVATRKLIGLEMLVLADSPGIPPSLLRRLRWLRRQRRAQTGGRPELPSAEAVVRRFHLIPTATTASAETLARLALASAEELPNGHWAFRFDPQTRAWRRRGGHLPAPDPRAVQIPTLILRGAGSTIVSPRLARWLHRKIAGSELRELPHTFHHITLDDPAATAKAISDFVRRHRAPYTQAQARVM